MTRTKSWRFAALVATGVFAVAAAGCARPGAGAGAPPTTAPGGHGGMDHGGDDHGGGAAHGGGHGGGGHGDGGAHDIPARLNHPPTAAQKAAAQKLVDDTKRLNAQRFATRGQAIAAGFVGLGDGVHFTNPAWRHDGKELDPNYPESLVFGVDGRLQAAMYQLEPGKTMDDVPDIAGNLTVWHGHSTLCFKSNDEKNPAYYQLGGVLINGRCTAGYQRPVPPMIHVWVVENKCGPFAGVDPGNATGSCTAKM